MPENPEERLYRVIAYASVATLDEARELAATVDRRLFAAPKIQIAVNAETWTENGRWENVA